MTEMPSGALKYFRIQLRSVHFPLYSCSFSGLPSVPCWSALTIRFSWPMRFQDNEVWFLLLGFYVLSKTMTKAKLQNRKTVSANVDTINLKRKTLEKERKRWRESADNEDIVVARHYEGLCSMVTRTTTLSVLSADTLSLSFPFFLKVFSFEIYRVFFFEVLGSPPLLCRVWSFSL